MKKKTEKDFVNWIKKQIDYYSPILGIQLHEIDIDRNDKNDHYLEITFAYPYLDPLIRYSEKSFQNWGKGLLKPDRILHELCHILTDPLYAKALERCVGRDEIEDERERLTDTISAIIRCLIPKSKGR